MLDLRTLLVPLLHTRDDTALVTCYCLAAPAQNALRLLRVKLSHICLAFAVQPVV